MDAIREIRKRLEKYPNARFEAGEDWIRYLPSSELGFSVEFATGPDGYTVAFDGWHEEFRDVKSALNCFAFGLSEDCRLKVVSRGGSPCKWAVEHLENGSWQSDSETGLLVFKFWRPAVVSYRQNKILRAEGD